MNMLDLESSFGGQVELNAEGVSHRAICKRPVCDDSISNRAYAEMG